MAIDSRRAYPGGSAIPVRPTRVSSRARWAGLFAVMLIVPVVLGWIGRPIATRAWRGVRLRLAERAIAQGRFDDAEDRLDLLISEEPRWTRPRLRRVEVDRRQGRITEAEEGLQRAVELGLPVEEGRREFALLRAGRDFSLAEKSLRRLLDEHPDDQEVRRALAEGQRTAR